MKNESAPTGYGAAALMAVQLSKTGIEPIQAWHTAVNKIFTGRPASIAKGCPKATFLGLAGAGHIAGIPSGDYTRSVDNKRYAEEALRLLHQDEAWSTKPAQLWSRAVNSTVAKRHNGQIDVVLGLWHARCFSFQNGE